MAHLARSLLNEVRLLIVFLSMVIIIVVVAASAVFFSMYQLSELRGRSVATADELTSLLEGPLYNVDDESAVRISRAFLTSGKIAGIEVRSTASGILLSDFGSPSSRYIPDISRDIHSHGMHLGSFSITFGDEEIWNNQVMFLVLSLVIIAGVLLANIFASRYITRRVQAPFSTIFSGIEDIAKGDYTTQIKPTRYQDIDILVDHFNDMASKINAKNQEQKRVEEKLLAERQFLVDIIDFLPDATFII
ncbi:MAG: hypothetical protein V2J11_11185, partial [Desulfofustis sp.]|nr:hypothetical protein [Desulfofustis sp.]